MNLEHYQSLDKDELKRRVAQAKKRFGKRLLILGHYYQQDDVIEFADHQGDSYALAKAGAQNRDAQFIVFCGVHFMAETSAILASRVGEALASPPVGQASRLSTSANRRDACSTEAPQLQRVFMPDPDAGCPLADMADIEQVEDAWEELQRQESRSQKPEQIIPITYINSSAELKAFCGKNGGIVCTSSNAGKAFDWALSTPHPDPLPQGERGLYPPPSTGGARGGWPKKIFFFPDEHLGRNTANAKGFKREDMVVWDPYNIPSPNTPSPLAGEGGGEGDISRAKVILWKGHCHVHTYFTVENIKAAREKYPGCKIAVHPECTEDVVKASDANGSTSFLKKYVEEAPAGSTVIIGTEINMVSRLAKQNPDKKIVPLARSLCPNMFKTSLADLCYTIENLPNVNEIMVPKYIIDDAKIALERMLSLA